MEAYIHTCASSHNQKEDNKFKNKKQPELTENQSVWKSDNQRVKEETFTQAGRRGRDGQPGREDLWQGSGQRTRAGKVVAGTTGGHTCECR